MKIFKVRYISYEGRLVSMEVEAPDDATESDVACKAIDEDIGYGDGIHKIIDVEMW